ncbi:MAG: hypothetical protein IBJ10_01400 [Phycisphaerales bacterium]|nr:hypothetical protein [Phycisphaerales bacterium]
MNERHHDNEGSGSIGGGVAVAAAPSAPASQNGAAARPRRHVETRQLHVRKPWMDRFEAWVSRLTASNNFVRRIASMIWLPYAFRSGIKIKRVDSSKFTAVLPFRRANRNWYNAMAGAALVGNSEISAGMYVYGRCGGDYTVVCKNLEYKFLRPCFGPAIYKATPRQDIDAFLAEGKEFNIDIDLEIVQQLPTRELKERRVGTCLCTFHVTPKSHHRDKKSRRRRK